ncbi:hypothetical protein AVEN_173111-1 [Araneus ventricosus]|uniref:Uncharacterized protein n=1 Tax=Araneus ventricosus TaxID=182803 RepID=A0A4Y2FMC1_ARAVE|nr:hypothetical protein AVEN_173111-1 [Araneus ventricosus]
MVSLLSRDSLPHSKGKNRELNKPGWNNECHQAQNNLRKARGRFRRYPATATDFRRIEWYNRRTSWKSFASSITPCISSRELWHKVKKTFGTRCMS